MKKLLLLLLYFLILLPILVKAEGVKINDIYYILDSDAKTAEVTYGPFEIDQRLDIGDPLNEIETIVYYITDGNYRGNVVIPESVTKNEVTYRVISIGGEYEYILYSRRMGSEHYDPYCEIVGAFSYCSGLSSVIIPNSVTSIGDYAFSDCTDLISVTVNWTTPIEISSNTFSNCENATLYVPAGCSANYAATDHWKDFKEIIEFSEPTNTLTYKVDAGSDTTLRLYSLCGNVCRILNSKRDINSFDGLRPGIYLFDSKKIVIR